MRIFISASTVGRYGGGLNGQLRHLPQVIQNELKKADVKSTFDQFWLTFSYPPLYVLSGVLDSKATFNNYYHNSLPYSRLSRKTKKVEITLQTPELSEHFDSREKDNYSNQFDIDDKYRNLADTDIAKIVIDKFIEAGKIINSKLKKDDVFEIATYNDVLINLRLRINADYLASMHITQTNASLEGSLQKAKALREKRKIEEKQKDKLIRDIRVYANDLPDKALYPYNHKYCNLFLDHLRKRKFQCPKYTHLYVQVAKTMDDALRQSFAYEEWYVNGLAVIDFDNYLRQPDNEKEKIVFSLIGTGLKDIATIDKLDIAAVEEVIAEIRIKNGL